MPDPDLLKRITSRQEVFGGKPIIRNMHISVELILSLLAQGETTESIIKDYRALMSMMCEHAWHTPGRQLPTIPLMRSRLAHEVPRGSLRGTPAC
jgi:uncharacterized protein (DUF433 family)